MILFLLFLLVLILAAALLLRRLVPRLRAELRTVRDGARAMPQLLRETELLYQAAMAPHTPQLPAAAPKSPFAEGSWKLVLGEGTGWPADAFYKVRGLATHGSALYASLTGPNADGRRGQVWRLDQNAAVQAGGGIGASWQEDDSFVDHVFSMDERTLLVAEKSGVWSLTDDRWTLLREGLALNEKCGPYSFAKWNGQAVMGQWGDPRVAVLGANGRWTYLPNPAGGWGAGTRTIYCLIEFKGALYAGTGTGKLNGQASTVWRYDGKAWEQVAGNGIRGSWARDGLPFVLSLTAFGERLVATVSRPADTAGAASSVWVFDGDRWGPLVVGATPALMGQSLIMNDAIVYRGRLVVATGHSTRRPAQIWQLDDNNAWQPVGPSQLADVPAGAGGWWVYRLCTDGDRLYASTAGHTGAARVFEFTPANFA